MIDQHARYTVVLKTLLDNPEAKKKIDEALSTYPIFIPGENSPAKQFIPTREQLNAKILNAYKYREIGFETPGRFIDELEITMNEIMPYYNQLMRSVEMLNEIDDIFGNINLTEKFEQENESNNQSDGTSTINNSGSESGSNEFERAFSDTPQGSVDNLEKYMSEASREKTETSNATQNTQISENESKNNSFSKTTYTHTKIGNQGVNTYAHDIIEFRQTILNVEQEIINDSRIKELFMQIY